ncbi:adenine deaminase [Terrisporobacter mayombei]|uniref:Adenine deaminase n=1 Tax=Terrisporobacter mayombei TaxID=1541 RepID=A0ABY9Q3C2_9FIRM|nr:adenine deaminase [Terrisporobacter mayombei]MCC3867426.1 adenine deaminase [Terrisporobacter mayombei]WMT81686.1 Adenine deaminase [Terrisporobacter mayombei]
MYISELIDRSMKNKNPDLVLKNANIVNVFTHEIVTGDVAVHDGIIVGIGEYTGDTNIDLKGKYIASGLIDSHVHIESSMLSPGEFSKAIVPRGTTTIITDPHEIANVCGLDGIEYILNSSEELPLNTYVMLPSCVPATNFENSGAVLKADDLEKYINHPRVLGLGEMMNYPGVIYKDKVVMDKLNLAYKNKKSVDGHAPRINGEGLNAYVLSGVNTDHECTTEEEMLEKLRLGMYVMIREGSATKDLKNLINGVNQYNYQRILLCTDDKHPEDLLKEGHIDYNVKLSIKNGIDPITAIQMATINPANCYNLKDVGAIAPGYKADIIVFDNLEKFNIEEVYKDGKLVGKEKMPLFTTKEKDISKVLKTVHLSKIDIEDIQIYFEKEDGEEEVNIISLKPHSLITEKSKAKVNIVQNKFEYDNEKDILKLAVIERHKNTGNIGIGLVESFKLKNGAIATTISHDSHNIIVVGDNDEDIVNAVNKVISMDGGIAISSSNEILESLPLNIGGLMSDKDIEYVNSRFSKLVDIAYDSLKVSKDIDPFLTLAFLALPVIPNIKLTDKGLFDVENFDFMSIVSK